MPSLADVSLVFVAGLITALATGLGALPLLVLEDITDRMYVVLWGVASGIMLSASIFGLIREALAVGTVAQVGLGCLTGIALVVISDSLLDRYDFDASDYANADMKQLLLILGILTVHSFPEGVAIGVSFANLSFDTGLSILGYTIPVLAVTMTLAISVHNIPEGVAISIPLRSKDVEGWKLVWWAIFSSLPQPLGAVIAFYFVQLAGGLLPIGFGFAAGAMVYLVAHEFLPEAAEHGKGLYKDGAFELSAGLGVGIVAMLPFFL